jgi:hypothetical protein
MDNQTQAIQYAYLAGIIDGEGWIGITKSTKADCVNPTYVPKIQVGMVDPNIPFFLKKVFGGSIHTESVQNRQLIYRWHLTSISELQNCLAAVIPYLIVKKEMAEQISEFIASRVDLHAFPHNSKDCEKLKSSEIQRRESYFQSLKKLNAVGAGATTKHLDTRKSEAIV